MKVVILGQEPYRQPGKANGLAYGATTPTPDLLQTILAEVHRDTGLTVTDTTLESWAKQGVLLLNLRLTTEAWQPMSHRGLGWEQITAHILQWLSIVVDKLIVLAWDEECQWVAKTYLPDDVLVLTADKFAFQGCGHFTKVNQWLKLHKKEPIIWGVSGDSTESAR